LECVLYRQDSEEKVHLRGGRPKKSRSRIDLHAAMLRRDPELLGHLALLSPFWISVRK